MKRRILIVDDEESLRLSLKFKLKSAGFDVDVAVDGEEALEKLKAKPADAVLLDVKMPRMSGIETLTTIRQRHPQTEVIILTVVHDIKTAVECMQRGAFYYVTKPYQVGDLLPVIERALERKQLVAHNKAFKSELSRRGQVEIIESQNEKFREVLGSALRAAPTASAVLIQGEVGTGRRMLANLIYSRSLLTAHPILSFNCSSMPEHLLESELFGQEGDSSTGTVAQQGLLELANGGTVLLQEIGEMSLPVQDKLLRFLERRDSLRTDGESIPRWDIRLISTTRRDLRGEVASKGFLEKLLLRVNTVTLELPPLRERKEDIPMLAEHFLKVHAGQKESRHLDGEAIELLTRYDWPGNVLELENVIARAALLSQATIIRADDLAKPLESGKSS